MSIIHTYGKAGWLRVGNLLLQWKHKSNPALFSERYGYIRFHKLGNYRFSIRFTKVK